MGANLELGGALSSRRARRRAARPMAEINVTPFVDVMLVLLIVFMVAAPLLTVGVEAVPEPSNLPKINLPKTEAGPVAEAQAPLTILVDQDGKLFLQSIEVTFDELVPKLTAIRAAGNEDAVRVRGDNSTQYGNVAKVLARVKKAGFPVVLITDQMDLP